LLGDAEVLRERLAVASVSDDEISAEIVRAHSEFGFAVCPHTATATHSYRGLDDAARGDRHWIAVATAHAAKFETVVEPLIGERVPLPPELEAILARPSHAVDILPELDALADCMQHTF
jgi:threonine synthase